MRIFPWLLAIFVQAPADGPMELAGRVVDAKQQPVAGAEVWVSGFAPVGAPLDSEGRTTANAEGRFHLTVPPQKDRRIANPEWTVWATQAGRGLGGQVFTRQSVAKAQGEPLVVTIAPPGDSAVRVLGPEGRGVVGAKVVPAFVRAEQPPGAGARNAQIPARPLPDELAERLATTTGPDGRGTLAGLAPGDLNAVRIESPGSGRQILSATADRDGSFAFRLAPVGHVAGRIVVDDPKLLQAVKVFVISRPATPGLRGASAWAEVAPDASGRFEVAELPVGSLFVNVRVPENSTLRFITPQKLAVEAGGRTEVTITERKPPKTRTLAGRVVDAKGNAIAGAVVFQSGDAPARTETTADAGGRFSLAGVAEASTFVFASKKGFRFTGRGVAAGESDVTITLTRDGEQPAGAAMKTLAPAATRAQESVAAHTLMDAYAAKVLAKGDMSARAQVLQVLARVDPARTLEITEGTAIKEPFLKGMIRMQVALALLESAPDEALAIAESIDEPAGQTLALLKAIEAVPAAETAKKEELLERMLISAKAARQPTGMRMVLMAKVAEQWFDMGRTEKAKALLREIQPDVEKLPDNGWPSYAKGVFAEELCQIDLDAALNLTKGLPTDNPYGRHHGNIAHELAGKDPAAAERVLGMVKNPNQYDQYVVRVVYRMAPVDLARARRLAATTVDPVQRGYAFGVGALALANAKRMSDATAMLREALETLAAAKGYGESPTRSIFDRAATCAALVAVAEQIDPALATETFWRSLSLREPPRPDGLNDPSRPCDLRVAVLLARYDRDVARALVARHVGPDVSDADLTIDRGLAFAAAAVIDPAWAVALVDRLREDPGVQVHSAKNAARLAAAAALARHGEGRWRYLQLHYGHLWVVDTEDLAPDL